MAATGGFWERMQEEVRSVSDRTRRGTRRAVRMGVLRVDLVSLRRDRSRALAHLGERALSAWGRPEPGALEQDGEAARLKELIARIDSSIAEKERELDRLSAGHDPEPAPSDPASDASKSSPPEVTQTHPMSDDGRGPS